MISFDPIDQLIEAARAALSGEPDALQLLAEALEGIDEAETESEENPRIIDRARDEYEKDSDGDIEIDDQPLLDSADDGMWVNAWLWVPDDDSQIR